MTPKEFTEKYYQFALASQAKSGINAKFILAQAALESGWGRIAPGYNFFGVKAQPSDKNRQLIRTTEYSTRGDLQFPEILTIDEIVINGSRRFKYRIRDWFKKYDSPEEAFNDHADFFHRNPRYRAALEVKHDPVKMAAMVAKAGYATDPDYAEKVIRIIKMIEKYT